MSTYTRTCRHITKHKAGCFIKFIISCLYCIKNKILIYIKLS